MGKQASIFRGVLLFFLATLAAFPASATAADFKVLFIGQQTIASQDCIAVTFSSEVDTSVDINRYLKLFSGESGEVDGAWVLNEKATTAYFVNIDADTEYEVQVRRGLSASSGRSLAETKRHTLRTRKVQASISFSSKGYILPAELAKGIPVNTMNVPTADIDFFRVREKYLVDFLALFTSHHQVGHYFSDEIQRYAELAYSARFDLEAPKNVLSQAILPITGIEPLEVPGVYLAVMRRAGDYQYEYPATYFSISDIGLHMRVYADTLTVQTQHLSSGKICAEVALTFYDKKGNILEKKLTDKQGSAAFANIKDKARLLVAAKGNDTTILPLNMPALDLSAFELGEQPFRELEFFVYGPRDLYRPGETMIMDALLRDYDGGLPQGKTGQAPPIAVSFKQPDGRKIKSLTWRGDTLNAYHYSFDLPAGAQTGTWTVEFRLAGKMLQLYKFRVEDFMPERMKLTLDNGNGETTRIGTKDAIAMAVQGDYLYGAPAAGNRVDCNVSMALQRALVERLPGFEFGDVDEKIKAEFTTEAIKLDDQGRGVIALDDQYAGVKSPAMVRLHTNLYESGGRPVSRDKVYHLWPADQLVGVRPLWEGEKPESDTPVSFEVVRTDALGTLLEARALAVTLIREYPDYYWQYNASSGWSRIVNHQHYPVAERRLDIQAGQKATINFPVEWGPYRLEIVDPATGLKTAHRFEAGWDWWGERGAGERGNRPDQVVLSLDKKNYRPGDTARMRIQPPEAGTAIVTVEADKPLWREMLPVRTEGTEVAIPIDLHWDRHDLHVSVMVIRPGDRHKKIAPKRALGIIHLPLDRTDRHLPVRIEAPEKTLPDTPLTVEVSVPPETAKASAQGELYVTLAAVDEGVLAITRFETPDPAGYFFNRRRYGVDCYDIYQKIIESHEGGLARKRYGGDAVAQMTRGGDKPMTDVRIVSLYQERLRLDADGKATITLNLPDFNGRLRLMAVAYGDRSFGQSEKAVTVAAPVVAEIAMPRFLAMGDESFLALDLQNLSGLDQDLTLALKTSDPIELSGTGTHEIHLQDKAKTTLRYPVRAGYAVGMGTIDLEIGGIRLEPGQPPLTIQRQWRLGTRPAYPAVTRQWRKALEPGEALEIPAEELEGLLPKTVTGDLTLTDQPPINVAEHIEALNAYPYGCLEQTTSGIYPQVLINDDTLEQLKINTQSAGKRRDKVQEGIDRLVTLQQVHGGFGLWSGSSPEECWLTAYVCDFLISARDRGYAVPAAALKKALGRLNKYLRRSKIIQTRYTADAAHTKFAVRAYSGFVLARLNKASLGTLRTLFDNHAKKSRTALPLVHLGLALQLQGDNKRAEKAFDRALGIRMTADNYYGEYGSPVRDTAMSYYLLSTYAPKNKTASTWLVKLDEALRDRRWLSTQERNALVLAGMQLLEGSGQVWEAEVKMNHTQEVIKTGEMQRFRHGHAALSRGLRIEAAGERTVFVNFLLNGYSKTAPAPDSHGIDIERAYYDLKGKGLTPGHLKTGDMVLVRLDVQSEKRVSEGLVVELLPAGLELENQNLATGFKIDDLEVDGKSVAKWKENLRLAHEEFRDDRYVAAVDVDRWHPAVLFYLARVVSPGRFQVPNAYVEDMYRPYIRAVGGRVAPIEITQP